MLMSQVRWREIDKKEHGAAEAHVGNSPNVAPSLEEGSCPPDVGMLMDFASFLLPTYLFPNKRITLSFSNHNDDAD